MVSVRPTPQTFPADFSKPSPTKIKIAVWWWIRMHICIIWMTVNTLYVIHCCGNHFGLIWGLNHSIRSWFLSNGHTLKTSADFQDSRPTDVTISVWWWIHIPLLSASNEWWQTPSIWQARIWQPHCIWSDASVTA
jgi:hypothetical protein